MKREDYPLILKVEHIAEILCVSKRKAYEIMGYRSFPLVKIGKAKRVGRDAFFNWVDNQNEAS
jgi:hypothetical protein